MKNIKIWNDIKIVTITLLSFIGLVAVAGLITFIIITTIHQSNGPKETQFIDLRAITTSNGSGTVYYDKNTGVMYYRLGDASFPILNQDGTPKLYSGDE